MRGAIRYTLPRGMKAYLKFHPTEQQIEAALKAMTDKQAHALAQAAAYDKPYEVAGTIRMITYNHATGKKPPFDDNDRTF
jgi:hypothetical protein